MRCAQVGCANLITREVDYGIDYGLVPGLEVNLAGSFQRIEDGASDPDRGTGPGDISVGAKWRVHGWEIPDGDIGVGVLPSVSMPLGRRQHDEDQIPTASRCWTFGALLCTSGSWKRISVNLDAGYTANGGTADERGGTRGTYAVDVGVGYLVCAHFQPEVDLSYSRDATDDGVAPWSLTVTVGAQMPFCWGRAMAGVSRVVDGVGTDQVAGITAGMQYDI